MQKLIEWIGVQSLDILITSCTNASNYAEDGGLRLAWGCFRCALIGHALMRVEFALMKIFPGKPINYDEVEIPF